jgi:hypothetical protein
MKRFCLMVACLSAFAWTQALAENPSPDPAKASRSHPAKSKHVAAVNSAILDSDIRFSDPYAPPEGTTLVKKSGGIRGYSYPAPKEPHGGLSISMGKDGGGHTTGGLGWSF